MRRVFVDTSAILALVNPSDRAHRDAKSAFDRLQAEEASLLTTSLVLVEVYALLGRRMGLAAVQAFRSEFSPLLEVVWVDETLFEKGLDLLLERAVRGLSLVDAVSFLVFRERRLEAAFAFDRHFETEGLPIVT